MHVYAVLYLYMHVSWHTLRASHGNRAAIDQLSSLGCRVILASGRRHENMLRFYRDLGLDDFVVSCQGAVARHAATGEVVHQELVGVVDGGKVIAEGHERGLTVMYRTTDGVFARQRSRWVERYQADCGGDPVTLLDVDSPVSGNSHGRTIPQYSPPLRHAGCG